jgi:hypothetical protein
MSVKVVAHEPGAWFLFSDAEGTRFLSVVCGRVGQYLVEFALTADETRWVDAQGFVAIHELAQAVYMHPEQYRARQTKLDAAAAKLAVENWRALPRAP